MKQWFVLLSMVFSMKTYSQDSLPDFGRKNAQINLTGMKVLGSWGIANIGVGATGWASSEGTHKYFHQMNTFWGAVNTGVAFLGYRGAQRKLSTQLTANEMVNEQRKTEKIFLINTGLDLAYIGTGVYLQNRGNNRGDAKLKGYGSSVILQGIFLAIFDATMYNLQRNNGNKLTKFLQANAIVLHDNKIGIVHAIK